MWKGCCRRSKRIGNLIAPLVVGDQGEVALIAYDARIRMLQDFTNDPRRSPRR